MSKDAAITVGVALDHLDSHCSILLSYGFTFRQKAFDTGCEYYPMIEELDGYIFTDTRYNDSAAVHVYQNSWMRDVCDDKDRAEGVIIGMSGDKGQVAELLNTPAVIFDDREDNVLQVQEARPGNLGYVVRVGDGRRRAVRSRLFAVSKEPTDWYAMSKAFHENCYQGLTDDEAMRLQRIRLQRMSKHFIGIRSQ